MSSATFAHLHDYDLQLCDYVRGNIQPHLGDKSYRELARRRIGSPDLFNYLLADTLDSDKQRLLNAEEFCLLIQAFGHPDLDRDWTPYESLHRRYVGTVGDVTRGLGQQVSEEWAQICQSKAKELEHPKTTLSEGIETVLEWVRQLRRLLEAGDAADLLPCPEGSCPTPTCTGQVQNHLSGETPELKPPSKEALMAYRLRVLRGVPTQRAIAEQLSKELKRPICQGQVSRWLKQAESFILAGGVFPALSQASKPVPMDPDRLDLGKRIDGRAIRQRPETTDK